MTKPQRSELDRLSSCVGKQQLTRETAMKVAKRGSRGSRMAYRCEHCAFWHVGTTNRMPKRRPS
jgi:hypothetical protein